MGIPKNTFMILPPPLNMHVTLEEGHIRPFKRTVKKFKPGMLASKITSTVQQAVQKGMIEIYLGEQTEQKYHYYSQEDYLKIQQRYKALQISLVKPEIPLILKAATEKVQQALVQVAQAAKEADLKTPLIQAKENKDRKEKQDKRVRPLFTRRPPKIFCFDEYTVAAAKKSYPHLYKDPTISPSNQKILNENKKD